VAKKITQPNQKKKHNGFAKGALPEEYLSHNFDEHCLEDTRLIWWGTIDPWALRFLVVREIDCGDWLARGYMSAHQHCDLLYKLVGDLLGSAVN